MMTNLNITLDKILLYSDILNEFGCCKLIINDKVIWDDDVEWNKYVKLSDALERFFAKNPNWNNYKINDVDIKIVHFHHSIISIYCEECHDNDDIERVVRCKYCKYYDEEQLECTVKFDSNGERLAMGAYHYCSDGKRRKHGVQN